MFTIWAVIGGTMQPLYHPLMVSDGYAVTSASVGLELGKAGSATITIPPTNPQYDKIFKMKTMIQIMNDREEVFCGRILHDEKDFYGNKELYLEGNLAFLIDRIMPFPSSDNGYKFEGTAHTYFGNCMDIYNNQSPGYSTLEMFDLTESYISTKFDSAIISFEEHEYVTIQDAIYDKIVNTCGGYLKTRLVRFDDNRIPIHTIDYVDAEDINNSEAGAFHHSGQTISFGENLLDFSEYVTAEDTFTVLIPLGKMQETEITYTDPSDGEQHKKTVNTQRIDISGVQRRQDIDPQDQGQLYVRDPIAQDAFGNIWKTVVWDDVENATELYGLAHNYLGQHNHIKTSLTINAVDLSLVDVNTDKLHAGDYVNIVSIPHKYGLSEPKIVQCVKVNLDLLNPGNSEYTFESSPKNISELQSSTASNIDSVKAQMSTQSGNASENYVALEKRVSSLETSSGDVGTLVERVTDIEEFDLNIETRVASLENKVVLPILHNTNLTTILGIYNSISDYSFENVYLTDTVSDRPVNSGGTLSVRKANSNYGSLVFYANNGTIWCSNVVNGTLASWQKLDYVV